MQELVINLHMHTLYSDGHGTHADLAEAALRAGLDAIVVTDHNVWVGGVEGYVYQGKQRVLVLVGEEIHDPTRSPQKNHLLVMGVNREMSGLASSPQNLINAVQRANGLSFIAHPVDSALPAFSEPDISWVDWQAQGYTGIELWNAFSEFKSVVHNQLEGLYYAFHPAAIAHGPLPDTLRIWDEQLALGRRLVAIGGSDAHALPRRWGPLHRTLFPYAFHFHGVNTHIWVPEPLSGNADLDRQSILEALRAGHAYVGLDQHTSSRGFRFTAQGRDQLAWMGDEIPARGGVTLQIHLPHPAECRLMKDGHAIKITRHRDHITHITTEPGVYRVEVYQQALGRRRGWIFSNPIYIREK